ncbi:hypothetical protein JMJ77_0006853 [Colletotrichum scovillei]|uniref:Uncharacterized protein n=1 Tax=Colletotrichum scovillei TaxID=1209932 RepID=A0A9P7RJF3_9PEZI|nr:hypothetical protein JMJ77_0006853 [Colletotrichum scovillei]KAG7078100.1 hypothetical protein JMJ76_0015335 [Colletotrichum scovillei]KAG7085220.1 hypothetical protein JMJ78_0010645 [Colletotrichum scovillei]
MFLWNAHRCALFCNRGVVDFHLRGSNVTTADTINTLPRNTGGALTTLHMSQRWEDESLAPTLGLEAFYSNEWRQCLKQSPSMLDDDVSR